MEVWDYVFLMIIFLGVVSVGIESFLRVKSVVSVLVKIYFFIVLILFFLFSFVW